MENFIEILKAIVFGIVEGITEWLPVSSTGHMIILEQFFSLADKQGKEFFDFFIVIIQLGAIVAVVLSFFKSLWPFGANKSAKQKREIWRTWLKILIASIPAGVIGLLFDDWLDGYLYNYLTVSIMLIVYGVAFLVIEFALRRRALRIKLRYHLNRASSTTFDDGVDEEKMTNYPLFRVHSVKELTVQMAMIIGIAQCLALIPGTSRSGVTICAALLMSVDRRTAARFSFYLSIPAMLGGSLIKGVLYAGKMISGDAPVITGFQIILILIAMAVAFGVSWVVIRFFMKMLRTKTFIAFGFYRIGLGIILLIILFAVNGGNLSTGILLDSTSSSTALLNTMDCLVANPTLLNFIPSLR
jgi:undecaprenyl-diphosphatase